jgi:hypothetical protein
MKELSHEIFHGWGQAASRRAGGMQLHLERGARQRFTRGLPKLRRLDVCCRE